MSREERLHLPLIVCVKHIIKRQAVSIEILLKAIPYRDDFRIICNGAEHKSALVMMICSVRTAACRKRPCR